MRRPRRVARFALLFVPLFAACLWLYVQVLPRYEAAVIGLANAATARLAHPTRIEVRPDGQWQSWVFTPEQGRHPLELWPRSTAYLITLSLAVLPALILATPIPAGTRWRLVALGLAAIFAVHVACTIGLMRGALCLRERPGSFACLCLLRLVYTSGQLLGAAVWAILTWKYWLPGSAPAPAAPDDRPENLR